MAGSRVFEPGRSVLSTFLLAIVFLMIVPDPAWAQGVGDVSAGLDLTPSNPLGLPGTTGGLPRGSDTLNLSSRMFPEILPTIPGLEISYLHSFGKWDDWSKFVVEYVRPVRFGGTTIRWEAHGIFHNVLDSSPFSNRGRLDLAIGGGIRTRLSNNTLVGAHGFFDATFLRGKWHSDVSVGGHMVAFLMGDDAIDLAINWYGSASTDIDLGPPAGFGLGTLDARLAYYHELWEGGPDLRLTIFGYTVDPTHLHILSRGEGYGARVALASRDGMFRASYQYERETYHEDIHTVGLNFRTGFSIEKLLAFESPVENPTPIFSSPRNRGAHEVAATQRPLRKELTRGYRQRGCDCNKCINAFNDFYWKFKWPGKHIDLDQCSRMSASCNKQCPRCSSVEWFFGRLPHSHACANCEMYLFTEAGTFTKKVGFHKSDWFRCLGQSCCYCNKCNDS